MNNEGFIMKKYNYNERLIEKLNIIPFIERYNFSNERYNTAIFCALSSLYSHRARIESIESKSILFGDYYSFEYYSLLKDELDKLSALTETMRVGYFQILTKRMSEEEFYLSIIKTWFDFYNIEFQEFDSKAVVFV